ncbi:TonB-dependent receptor [Altererythrobacter sp. B11]|uniref:TonB-dependent receptor n=1 Tax=Altererythrobacter sp. B11 TaxID=2060312 RepID=UPI000DC6EEEA|nr:TonB-dependent receptor [Altererythrobacter sp. B11]BBC71783.1 TonB-dependent receptor [Altererythrobacter sp. B11]
MNAFRVSLLLTASLLTASPALAQSTPAPSSPDTERPATTADDFHGPIVVTAAGLRRLDVLAGTSVLDGTELLRDLDSQLGETLAKLPGVSATSFAPGASRPILRGFGGERVRVLTDGVGAIDASGTSADHAVTVDPLIAERIEILRGPAALLYGGQAIGGAVNVITKRIPPSVPQEPIHVDALASVDSAYNRREGGLSVDVPVGSSVAFHVDGSYRNTDDVDIPGYVASPSLRAGLLADAAEEQEEGHLDEAAELRETANVRGKLPNSWTETYTLGTGVAFFSGDSNIGVSFDYYDTNYGVPGLPGIGHVHDHEDGAAEEAAEEEDHGEENVSIGMKRYRVDLRGTLDLGEGFFEKVQTRWGYSDYTHTEFEGAETGTIFDVEGVEGRVELVQSRRGGWQGSIGGQYSHVDFSATGEEAFVPPNKTDSFALFTVQEVDLDPIEVEAGGRYERTTVDVAALGENRDFDAFSFAAGASYRVAAEVRAGVNLSRAERAPSAQELFADGPHVATQQYEVGNAALDKEGSWGVEGYVRGDLGPARFSASIYRNWFDGFIFLSETGDEDDGLPVYQFLQQDADQWGIEGEVSLPLYASGDFSLQTDLRGAYTRATLADGTPVPRIPPFNLLGALEAQAGHFDLRGEVEWYDRQDRIAPLETPTDGFTFVNLSVAWHPLEGSNNVTLIAQVDNVFDTEGRRAASFTKDFVPLAGRNFKLSARASF